LSEISKASSRQSSLSQNNSSFIKDELFRSFVSPSTNSRIPSALGYHLPLRAFREESLFSIVVAGQSWRICLRQPDLIKTFTTIETMTAATKIKEGWNRGRPYHRLINRHRGNQEKSMSGWSRREKERKRTEKGDRREKEGEGDNEWNRKRSIYRAALPVPQEMSGKVCLCANYDRNASYMRVRMCACARMAGWLTSIKLVAIDCEKDRAESSPVRGDGIFLSARVDEPSPSRIAKLRFAPSSSGGKGQGLECLTAGS